MKISPARIRSWMASPNGRVVMNEAAVAIAEDLHAIAKLLPSGEEPKEYLVKLLFPRFYKSVNTNED
ncbi:MAG: hypothetical protein VYC14_02490 [Actinomycetota bacterium]|nr:hypothetical protein [Actinomycetota bacterium]